MDIAAHTGPLTGIDADAVVVNHFQDATALAPVTAAVNEALGGAIARLLETEDFRGKLNQVAVLYPAPDQPLAARRVLLVGLGRRAEFTLDRCRQVAATSARRARDLGVRHLATKLHGVGAGILPAGDAAQAVVEGTLLGLYRYDELKSAGDDEDARAKHVERLTLAEPDEARILDVEAGLARGRILAESANLTRTLASRPANVLPPRAMAAVAKQVAEETGLRCEILEPPQIAELGMGGLMGVAQGADEPARFIILEHAPEGLAGQAPVVLCGKGITFDTGGISIKPSQGMEAMKDDMAGGAAVIGAMRALALLKVPQRAIGLVPATENMPSGKAMRPGDVLRIMDGQTIEVISTDAEGRLVLADALAYAHRFSPRAMVDIATLTGGVVTALGSAAAGVMANDPDVVARLQQAAGATGEKVWELPLWDEDYKRAIRSDVADMKNTGGRAASAIAGGMLLKRFAKQVPWAHIDIAGTSWTDSDSPYKPKGATGYGVRLLTTFVESYAAS